MRDAGIETPPALTDLVDQLDLMVGEVALGADELMVGNKAQSLNPFKGIGRNDLCPCESGKKIQAVLWSITWLSRIAALST